MATLTPGALYELVARGVKDTYISTQAVSDSGVKQEYINPYTQAQEPVQPVIAETRYTQAKSSQPLEFDIDIFGDIIETLRFKITLPSWLPSELPISSENNAPASFVERLYTITDASGIEYYYTPSIAYFAFKKITVFQDNQIIYSIDGDGLYALAAEHGKSLGEAWICDRLTSAQKELWVDLPFPGTLAAGGRGFPICALYGGQCFRVRCEMRTLDELVASTAPVLQYPWGRQLYYTAADGSQHSFTATTRTAMQPLLVELENRQLYIDNAARDVYSSTFHQIIFKTPFKNNWIITPRDYEPLARGAAEAILVRQIDGRHPVGEIVIMTRNQERIRKNLYTAVEANFYTSIRMTIAGQERETAWSEKVLGDVENLARMGIYRRIEDQGIIRYNWTIEPDNIVGTINFSTATKPIIQFSLAPNTQHSVQDIYIIGWGVYEISDGRGKLAFYN